jgi:outer membrane protein assembly factor BamB
MCAKFRTVLFICAIAAAGFASSSAQEWNQWRGPSRTGAASLFVPPASWPDRPTEQWKVKSAGIGHSSPVISNGRVYLHSRLGEQEAVTAYDLASGKQIWQQTYDAPYQMNPAAAGHGKGPKSTPVIDSGRLYTFGISGVLSAFDTRDGKLLWRNDHKGEFPATSPEFGTAMSPLIDGATLIVHAGGSRNGALTAYDAATGAVRWRWKGDGPAYASPVIASFGGTRQVITQTQGNLVGISARDGTLLWQIPFTTAYEQNIVTPLVVDGVLIYGGINKPTTAVRISQSADKWNTEQVWENADVPMYMSSPVHAKGYVYGLTHRNRGQFFCLDAKTGKTMWTTKGREGENASLVISGDLLLAATTEGELIVARQNPSAFDVVKRYTVAESPVWAHPAPAGRGVVIKDAESLTYWTFSRG